MLFVIVDEPCSDIRIFDTIQLYGWIANDNSVSKVGVGVETLLR